MLSVLCLCGKSGRARKDYDFQVFLLHFRLSFLIVKRLLTLLTCFYMSPIHHCRAMMQRGAEGPKAIIMNSCRKVMWIRFLILESM